jgi:hypothetical protein
MSTRFYPVVIAIMALSGCIYIPTPDHGYVSGRAVITDDAIQAVRERVDVNSRESILLDFGEPNLRYNHDEYFCYGWASIQGYWFTGDPSGYGGATGGAVPRTHWLCMQFDQSGILKHVEEIAPLSFWNADDLRDETLRKWSESGSVEEIRVTYEDYDLDEIRREIIHALAVDGFPEAQWRLYDEFGKKPDDRVWLCRSADSGYAKAQLEVGRIYWDNSGIPKHRIKAYVWYRLATAGNRLHGNPADRETLIQAGDAIREAVNTLDQGQLVEAYDRYSEWETGQCELELANLRSE